MPGKRESNNKRVRYSSASLAGTGFPRARALGSEFCELLAATTPGAGPGKIAFVTTNIREHSGAGCERPLRRLQAPIRRT